MAPLDPPGAPVPGTEIQPNGYLVNPLAVFVSEYWGCEKTGEFLPLNHVPPASPFPTP